MGCKVVLTHAADMALARPFFTPSNQAAEGFLLPPLGSCETLADAADDVVGVGTTEEDRRLREDATAEASATCTVASACCNDMKYILPTRIVSRDGRRLVMVIAGKNSTSIGKQMMTG